MRKERFAETLFLLVSPADRAASAIGDLIEDERGRVWFWRAVAELWLSLLRRDLMVAPLAMTASCVVGWFFYMFLSAALALVGYVAVTLVWGIAYVLTHHTGAELLAEVLRIHFDWPPIPAWAWYLTQAAVLFAIAPFLIGRGSTHFWRGHELSLALVMLIVWTAMATFVPLVLVGVAGRPLMVPVMVMFVLAGALFERFRPAAASS